MAYNKIEKLPQNLKDKFMSDMASNPHNKKVVNKLIDSTIKNNLHGKGIEQPLTWFTPVIINALEKQNIRLQTPVVVFEDRQVKHSIGDQKISKQRVTEKQFKNLYDYIKNPDEVFIDLQMNTVTYVKMLSGKDVADNRDCIKIPVKINTSGKRYPVNYIGTTARVNYKSEFSGKRYKKIE